MPKAYFKIRPPRERLSRQEWAVMRTCWRLGRPFTVHEIHEATLVKGALVRDYRTIKTYLDRMELKGYLRVRPNTSDSRTKLYEVAVSMEPVLRREIEVFLDEVIGEDAQSLALLQEMLASRRPLLPP